MLSAILTIALAQAGPKVEMGVLYSRVAKEELKMDLYYPPAGTRKPYPAIVLFHGGAWTMGNRSDMGGLAKMFAAKGVFAATASYRLAPKYRYPAMVDDAQTAMRFLRANSGKYGVDVRKIGAGGDSAGGQMALMLGTTGTRDPRTTEYRMQSSRAQAVLNIFGPVDLTNRQDFGVALDPLFFLILGKPRAQGEKEIRDASPLYKVSSEDAPTFTIHGTLDPLVPVNQAKLLEAALKDAGVKQKTILVKDMKHGIDYSVKGTREALEEGVDTVSSWLASSR